MKKETRTTLVELGPTEMVVKVCKNVKADGVLTDMDYFRVWYGIKAVLSLLINCIECDGSPDGDTPIQLRYILEPIEELLAKRSSTSQILEEYHESKRDQAG